MTITIHTHGPLLDVHVTEVLSNEDLPALTDAMERARGRGPFVMLTDTQKMKSAPRAVISNFAERMKGIPSMKDVWLGDAVVLSSPVVRFVVSTLIMIAPLPTEVRVFEHRAEALAWLASLLRNAGIPVPPSLRQTA